MSKKILTVAEAVKEGLVSAKVLADVNEVIDFIAAKIEKQESENAKTIFKLILKGAIG